MKDNYCYNMYCKDYKVLQFSVRLMLEALKGVVDYALDKFSINIDLCVGSGDDRRFNRIRFMINRGSFICTSDFKTEYIYNEGGFIVKIPYKTDSIDVFIEYGDRHKMNASVLHLTNNAKIMCMHENKVKVHTMTVFNAGDYRNDNNKIDVTSEDIVCIGMDSLSYNKRDIERKCSSGEYKIFGFDLKNPFDKCRECFILTSFSD